MEENTTIIEENFESSEELTTEDIQNDDISITTESSTESGENTIIDNLDYDSGISETVEESAAVPEETDTASDSTEETTEETTEELETIEEEMTIEEYVSGNEIPEQVALYYQVETETEESIPFLNKPLNEYTTAEGLLLLIFILAFVGLWYKIIFD